MNDKDTLRIVNDSLRSSDLDFNIGAVIDVSATRCQRCFITSIMINGSPYPCGKALSSVDEKVCINGSTTLAYECLKLGRNIRFYDNSMYTKNDISIVGILRDLIADINKIKEAHE